MRVSRHWWLVLGVTNVSSRTSAAFLKPGVDVADMPLFGLLAHRQSAVLGFLEIFLGPLQRVQFGRRHRGPFAGLRRRGRHAHPDVSVRSRVRAAGPQAHQRIDDERQRLEIDFDFFDGFGGGEFVDRGHGENRLALKQRLIGQRRDIPCGLARITVPLSLMLSAGAGRSSAVRIALTPGIASAALASMLRTRACGMGLSSQLAEQHAVGAIVLGVFRLARHFREEVARSCSSCRSVCICSGGVTFGMVTPSSDSLRRASCAVRILS